MLDFELNHMPPPIRRDIHLAACEPSTIRFASRREPDVWFAPEWPEAWFLDAFQGTMGELPDSFTEGRGPKIGGRENLGTMALADACHRSPGDHRPVRIEEIVEGGEP